MTKEQTIKVLELLNAFYAGGKNDPQQQVIAWHLILKDYDFQDAMNAVLNYAKTDRREYAQFPTVGRIIEQIEKEKSDRHKAVKEVITAISYGRPYEALTSDARLLISNEDYNEWLSIDAEEFSQKADILELMLKREQVKLLQGDTK